MTQTHPIQRFKNWWHMLQAIYANIKYGFPYKKLKIIAVTGSDGKTTTTSLIYHILKEAGLKVAYISTISAKIGDEELDTGLHVTTPDPWQVPRYLQMMLAKGIEYVVLESTSSGLQQNRLWGIKFDSATITNIKYDHLDYHGTWENYAQAKFQVLKKLVNKGLAVLNTDDEKASAWLKRKLKDFKNNIHVVWYSKTEVKSLKEAAEGMSFEYKGGTYEVPLIGKYNIENTLAAVNICLKYLQPSQIAAALKSFQAPKGRMELVASAPFKVIIDFAHTPNAFEKALQSVLTIKHVKGRLIVVFGCAGKRDKARREMGKVAADLADIAVLTAEDPRNEDLAEVNSEIFQYAEKSENPVKLLARFANSAAFTESNIDKIKQQIITNSKSNTKSFISFEENSVNSRKDAIKFALSIADPQDIVFITGKAHEQSLAFGDPEVEYPWSDHLVVVEALQSI